MSDMSGQAADGGYRPAGWYHAQGDPAGTQRYWDGAAWQGEPQPVDQSGRYQGASEPAGLASGGFGQETPSGPAVSAPDPSTAMGADVGRPVGSPIPGGSGGGGFISTLFDTTFKSFITMRAISVVYILVLIVVGLITLGFVLTGLARGGAGALLTLILGPLIGLLYLVMIRMTLEFFVNQFRQTELLEAIAEKLDRS